MSKVNMTESPEFKAWFGDSKVVDSTGQPLVVYHGTKNNFNTFDASKQLIGWAGRGFYFTKNREEAENYGGTLLEAYLSIQNPFIVQTDTVNPDSTVNWSAGILEQMSNAYPEYDTRNPDPSEILKKHGHDGIFWGDNIIAFYPTQIKSATGNSGKFDAQDPNIVASVTASTQTDSQAFKAWFGASKVVDAQGQPLVVYHGTNSDFKLFKEHPGWSRSGFYFTPDPATALEYTDERNISDTGTPRILPVYLSLKNPLDVREGWPSNVAEELDHVVNYEWLTTLPPSQFWEAMDGDVGVGLRYALKDFGYDGLIGVEAGVITYVAFDPEQIKSATGNSGKFDADNPDITASLTAGRCPSTTAPQLPKLMSLKKQAANFWVAPNGKGTMLDGESHGEYVINKILKDKSLATAPQEMVYQLAFDKGYARMVTEGDDIFIEATSNMSPQVKALIKDLLKDAAKLRGHAVLTLDDVDYESDNLIQLRELLQKSGLATTAAVSNTQLSKPMSQVKNSAKLVYHATDADFDTFNITGFGAHFGTREQAISRANDKGIQKPRIITARLTLNNPYDIVSDLGDWEDMDMLEEYLAEANEGPFTDAEFAQFKTPEDVRRGMEAKGYDGVLYENQFEGDDSNAISYIVFSPEQIEIVKARRVKTNKNFSVLGTADLPLESVSKVMYHGEGTGAGFGSDLGAGIYWAETEDYAEVFGDVVTMAKVQVDNVLYADEELLSDLSESISGTRDWPENQMLFDELKARGVKGIYHFAIDESENEFVDWTMTTKALLKTAAKKPTVFLGGEVQTDWREDVIDELATDLKLIDPVDDDWKPEENIYEELTDLATADEVVFLNGGEGTKKEKAFLDALDKPYEEFTEVEDLIGHLETLAGAAHSKGCLMLPVPARISNHLLKDIVSEYVDPADLVPEEGTLMGVESQSHVTLLYGLPADTDAEHIQAVLSEEFTKPITLNIGEAVEYFDHDDKTVAVIKVDSPELHALREAIEYLAPDQTYPVYQPHITLCYLKPGTRLEGVKVQPFSWQADEVIFSQANDEQIIIGLHGADESDAVEVLSGYMRKEWR